MMNKLTLKNWFEKNKPTYKDLAECCGSVVELVFRLSVFGTKWTKWDWVFFLGFLDYEYRLRTDDTEPEGATVKHSSLFSDIIDTIDNGDRLDFIMTNKLIISNMIEWTECYPARKGLLTIIAHVVKKFPDIWKQNWMWIRHRNGSRSHRLMRFMNSKSEFTYENFIEKYF